MRHAWIWLCALALLPLKAEEPPSPPQITWREAWRGVDEAMRLYEAGDYAAAAQLFALVREQAPEGEMDLDALRLMEGTAQWNAGNPDAARSALEEYEDLASDLHKVQKRQVMGSSNLALAEQLAAQQQTEANPEGLTTAKERAEDAKSAFQSALEIDPADDTTLRQLERTLNLIQELEELEQQQQEQQDQEDQEDQEQQDQENQEEQESGDDQQEQEQEQGEDPQDQEQEEQQDEQEGEEESESDSSEEESEEQDQDAESQGKDQEESEPEDQQSQGSSGQEPEETQDLSEQQAQQLLQTYDEQERRQRRQFLEQRIRSIPVEKDW